MTWVFSLNATLRLTSGQRQKISLGISEPGKAWYELHDWYWANRDGFLQANEGYVFGGYGEQVRRFLFAPKDSPVHP